MSIARSTGAFIGTDETTGVTIANNATQTGTEVDVLGDNASAGDVELYLVYTSTAAAGQMNIRVNKRRVSGQAYSKQTFDRSIVPINGSEKLSLGRYSAARYMTVDLQNSAVGVSLTNVSVLYELYKVS